MKKLMITLGAVAMAAAVQAATVDWSFGPTAIASSDVEAWADEEGSATLASAGWGIYVFDQASFSAVQTALAGGDIDAITAAINANKIGSSSFDSSASANILGTTMAGSAGGTSTGYFVIVDAADLGSATALFLSGMTTANINGGGTGTMTPYGGFTGEYQEYGMIDATQYGTFITSGSNGWYEVAAVPEPTSGLLLLLGMGALALRRRRA